MMGYKDKTWCSRFTSGDCKNKECYLALTKDEVVRATKWWGSVNFPVSMGDRKTEDCGYEG